MTVSAEPVGVREERCGTVAVVIIDRPPLNLLNQEIRCALGDLFPALASDMTVRAIVLAGAGSNFCAGADMKEFPLRFDPKIARQHGLNGQRMTLGVVTCPKPTIAAIEGACLGGGLELALSCDFRVAAGGSRMGLPEIRRGIWPGTGGIPLLSRLIGAQKAKELILDGTMMDTEAAHAAGMLDRVVEQGGALEAALAWAIELSERPGQAVRSVKTLMDGSFSASLREYFARELEAYVACYQTADAREGNSAFFEKRTPKWTHGLGKNS